MSGSAIARLAQRSVGLTALGRLYPHQPIEPNGLAQAADVRLLRLDEAQLRIVPDRLAHMLGDDDVAGVGRSEEHTSELHSRENLVCRLVLEKEKNKEM